MKNQLSKEPFFAIDLTTRFNFLLPTISGYSLHWGWLQGFYCIEDFAGNKKKNLKFLLSSFSSGHGGCAMWTVPFAFGRRGNSDTGIVKPFEKTLKQIKFWNCNDKFIFWLWIFDTGRQTKKPKERRQKRERERERDLI